MATGEPAPEAVNLRLTCGVCTTELRPTEPSGSCTWRCPECQTVRVNLGSIDATTR